MKRSSASRSWGKWTTALWLTGTLWAQGGNGGIRETGEQTQNTRPSILQQVGIDQKIGDQLPLETQFRDENGKTVKLGDYFHSKRPVLLALVYYDCPMLCNQALNGLTSALMVLKFNAGQEFEVVTVSFDPRETPELAQAKKQVFVGRYKRPGAEQGFHFLTGDKPAIDAVTRATGFRYVWDENTQQFAHSSGIMLVTPEGKLAQYYYGIEYSPKDMRLGIIEASDERLGNLADVVLLYCYHYDPMTGKYGAVAMNLIRAGGALTVLLLGAFIAISLRRERQQNRMLEAMARGQTGTN